MGSQLLVIERLTVGILQTNCYIVGDPSTKEALVIDPGDEVERILAALSSRGLRAKAIIATHTHFDHILAVNSVRKATGAPFYIHRDDLPILLTAQQRAKRFMGLDIQPPPSVDSFMQEGDILPLGASSLQVLHTPGHSPGSVSLLAPSVVFTGDTLFLGSVGRTDTPGGDWSCLVASIRNKLYRLLDETIAYPGHGPDTTIGLEKKSNPHVPERS